MILLYKYITALWVYRAVFCGEFFGGRMGERGGRLRREWETAGGDTPPLRLLWLKKRRR
jgi:hypothetical protein